MDDVEDFLSTVVPRLAAESLALQNGDPAPRMAMWSHDDPVTLFGAELNGRGWAEVQPAFEWLAASFSGGESVDYEVLAAGVSGDLGYLVAIERSVLSRDGAPPTRIDLRVTLILRREDDAWKVVHRHGDPYDAPTRDVLAARAATVRPRGPRGRTSPG